jgi:hypothetical protein
MISVEQINQCGRFGLRVHQLLLELKLIKMAGKWVVTGKHITVGLYIIV